MIENEIAVATRDGVMATFSARPSAPGSAARIVVEVSTAFAMSERAPDAGIEDRRQNVGDDHAGHIERAGDQHRAHHQRIVARHHGVFSECRNTKMMMNVSAGRAQPHRAVDQCPGGVGFRSRLTQCRAPLSAW